SEDGDAHGRRARRADSVVYQQSMREEGFPPAIISAVNALTRRTDEPDEDFVRRAASNPLSLPVKRADLEDNLRQAEQAGKKT
ncbi:hypothetical protein ACC676_39155, partial [Rhizobium ruizarguesonis]